MMPDVCEIHLPHSTFKEIYEFYSGKINQAQRVSYAHFVNLLHNHPLNIKVRQVKRFSTCNVCAMFDAHKNNATTAAAKEHWKAEKADHLSQSGAEKKKYYKHRSKAKNNPELFFSLIMDAMDQCKTEVPRMCDGAKHTDNMNRLKLKLTGA